MSVSKYLRRSDIERTFSEKDVEANSSMIGVQAMTREMGKYFGSCVVFNPPGVTPVGYKNKVAAIRNRT